VIVLELKIFLKTFGEVPKLDVMSITIPGIQIILKPELIITLTTIKMMTTLAALIFLVQGLLYSLILLAYTSVVREEELLSLTLLDPILKQSCALMAPHHVLRKLILKIQYAMLRKTIKITVLSITWNSLRMTLRHLKTLLNNLTKMDSSYLQAKRVLGYLLLLLN
jgi:hypothetical protein